ncbi:RNase H family protein [Streptococcus hyointestinalis]|uniref:ribonuclease H n=1 Tax=Streptococcus hyointestinalis TaxID=1337 RepID=A0A380JZ98_9STRE|nr:RNase H family protein [Streptococcus hyointestinalis]SUN58161.1 Predicted double-stranded RNA/RNA-DNA hybrid binding protein [Streptococcus hyointestinalis]
MNTIVKEAVSYTIFTDGSFKKIKGEKTNAASAYIVLNDNGEIITKGRGIIPNQKEGLINSLGAELVPVINALKYICKTANIVKVNVKIMTDYQELEYFHYLLRYRKKPKGHFKRLKLTSRLEKPQWIWYYANLFQVIHMFEKNGKELALEIQWCKGHSGIVWNEEADRLAKKSVDKGLKQQLNSKNKRLASS